MKRFFNNLPLGSKISLFTSTMIGVSLLILTIVTISFEEEYSKKDLEEQASILLSTLPYSIRDELYFIAIDELKDVAGQIGQSKNIIRFVIYDRKGSILADSSDKDLIPSQEPDAFGEILVGLDAGEDYTLWDYHQVISGQAVYLSTETIGAVSVTISTDSVTEKINALIVRSIALFFAIMIIGVSLSFLFSRQLSNPLHELMQVSREMASGNISIRVDMDSGDEIGELGLAFNEMTESIQMRERDLRNLAASLEEKVEERTEELRQRNEELVQIAISDPLTKIYNRRFFFDLAKKEYNRAKRYQHPLSLILADADHFKRANDTYGHLVGDQILINLAQFLVGHIRDADVVARYGGEEFVILMPEIDGEAARITAERLCQEIANRSLLKNKDIKITISLGVACWDGKEDIDFEALLNRADKALYHSKAQGRNRVSIWGENGIS